MRGHCTLAIKILCLLGLTGAVFKLRQARAKCGLGVVHGHVTSLLWLQQLVTSCLVYRLPGELLTHFARSHKLPAVCGRALLHSCHVGPAAEHMSCLQVCARGHTLPAARGGAVLVIYQMLYQLPDRTLPQFAQGELSQATDGI